LTLLVPDKRTDDSGGITRIPDRAHWSHGFDTLDIRFEQVLGQQKSRRDGACLSGMHQHLHESYSCKVTFGDIVEDDVRTLAAEFQLHAFHRCRRYLADASTGHRRTGEPDHVDASVGAQFLSHVRTAHNDVEHSGWEARYLTNLGQLQGVSSEVSFSAF
jgi:hypothetical protein